MSKGNKNVIMIMGKPASGKSASLRNIRNREGWSYFNTDQKELPFAGEFGIELDIENPLELLDYIDQIEAHEPAEGGVIDTLTFLMDNYAAQFVTAPGIADTRSAWGNYGKFYHDVMHKIKSGSKDYVVFAHAADRLNEKEHIEETYIPIQGAKGKRGVEGDFSIILTSCMMRVSDLEQWDNELLNITEDEREDGFKYVFQTRNTKETIGAKNRAPMGLWTRKQLYIDNDVQMVLDRVKQFYNR